VKPQKKKEKRTAPTNEVATVRSGKGESSSYMFTSGLN
jgi:hypothetical protein